MKGISNGLQESLNAVQDSQRKLKRASQNVLLYCSFSVAQSCLILCNPINCGVPGSSVLHSFLEFAHSCPLSQWCCLTISSSFSFSLQSFPASGSFQDLMSLFFSSETTVLELQLQHQSFQWIVKVEISFRIDWSDQFKGLSRAFSNTTIQKHQFFSTPPSLWSNSHIFCLTFHIRQKRSALAMFPLCLRKWRLLFGGVWNIHSNHILNFCFEVIVDLHAVLRDNTETSHITFI